MSLRTHFPWLKIDSLWVYNGFTDNTKSRVFGLTDEGEMQMLSSLPDRLVVFLLAAGMYGNTQTGLTPELHRRARHRSVEKPEKLSSRAFDNYSGELASWFEWYNADGTQPQRVYREQVVRWTNPQAVRWFDVVPPGVIASELRRPREDDPDTHLGDFLRWWRLKKELKLSQLKKKLPKGLDLEELEADGLNDGRLLSRVAQAYHLRTEEVEGWFRLTQQGVLYRTPTDFVCGHASERSGVQVFQPLRKALHLGTYPGMQTECVELSGGATLPGQIGPGLTLVMMQAGSMLIEFEATRESSAWSQMVLPGELFQFRTWRIYRFVNAHDRQAARFLRVRTIPM